ncbi:hypothetical protein MRS44_006071 [Fusarium solani]|uniref:uncharacterized protein n=1 Tax=Fusarium solani TaxID=169388 RepID=UPI0032C49B9E|nr:hypothetical protein MRS44_006071 [Fusarium solani]
MPLETFHIFPNLPGELREEIWRCALRPDGPARPGAHFFGVVSPRADGRAKLVNHALVLRDSTFDREICLVGPLWGSTSIEGKLIDKLEPASWIDNNPSTYLIDSGLWMACKESRHVIDQVFHQQQRDGTRSNSFRRMPLAYRNEAKMQDDAKDRFITVFPRWGIEVNHPDYYEWGMILQNLSNIAIDAAWKSGVRDFLFIDYRIKRRHHVPTKEQADMPAELTFYHQGRRFIDVEFHREDSIWEQDYDVAQDEMSGNMFVHALQDAANAIIQRVPELYEEHLELPYFGILACEEDWSLMEPRFAYSQSSFEQFLFCGGSCHSHFADDA